MPGVFGEIMRARLFYFLALALAIAFFAPARSYAATSVRVDQVTLDVSLESAVKPGSTVWVAIRQVIAPGWHTYWRNPGDAGLATTLSWTLPGGTAAGDPLWPAPEKFINGPVVDFGYRNEATLLVPITAKVVSDSAAPAQVKVFLLECAQMCIPEQATLTFDLHQASGTAKVFAKARAALPHPFGGTARVSVTASTLDVSLTDPLLAGVRPETVRIFPATMNAVNYDVPAITTLKGNTLTWHSGKSTHSKAFGNFSFVLETANSGSFDVAATVQHAAAFAPSQTSGDLTLVAAALMAFVGGLILNLMPCVLPILSMKALSFVQSGGVVRTLRRDGIAYFAGVLATFAAISAILVLLKSGGVAIGWGFQLQSPLIVFGLLLLMMAVGLNLLGLFELPLRLTGMGNSLTQAAGMHGAFFTGMLAVVVASPCTAPFMGAALSYALTQSAISTIVVFLALGTGFALPFTAVAFTPGLIRLLPKPGPWMAGVREFLAFPMFATAIWLTWVLVQQVGAAGVAVALSVGLGIVFLIWLTPLLSRRLRIFTWAAGSLALGALSLNIRSAPVQDEWSPWSVEAVTDARRNGQPVFVDFSAAWCVTCLVNEHIALNDAAVVQRLQQHHVLKLRADWTNYNSAITEELGLHGRSGVPLYLLYPPRQQGTAIVLPQILTAAIMLKALETIGHSASSGRSRQMTTSLASR